MTILGRTVLQSLAASALLLGMSGCATNSGTAAPAAAAPTAGGALAGGEWIVAEIGGAGIVDGSRPTIEFKDGRVFGAASCNRFMGGYEAGTEFNIKLGQMASTMMACPDTLMAQESKFLDILGASTSYSIDSSGALVLKAPDGRTIKARRA